MSWDVGSRTDAEDPLKAGVDHVKVLIVEGEGMAVDVMADGVDGLWAATENPYDAIVLDLMLPGISGRDVLVALRERGVWTPVLVLTAREGEEVQIGVFDRGADDFLAKPF